MAASAGRKLPIIGLVGLLIGLVAGYGTGRISTGTSIGSLSDRNKAYQEGYDAAKKKVQDAHLFPAPLTRATILNGTVKSVGTDSLVVEVEIQSVNPLDEIDAPKERAVTVSSETKLTKQVAKSPEDLQKESAAFEKSLASDTPIVTPDPFRLEDTTLDAIHAGDRVTLTADHDILTAPAFAVTAIQVQLPPTALPIIPPPGAPLMPVAATATTPGP